MTLTATPTQAIADPVTGRAALTARHRELRSRLAGTPPAVLSAATTLLVSGPVTAPPPQLRVGFAITDAGVDVDLTDVDDIAPAHRDSYAQFLDQLFAAAARPRGHRHTVTLNHRIDQPI